MSQGSLYDCLHSSINSSFCWSRKGLKVLVDLAEGLRYLHCSRPVIVHFDIKSGNALINADGTAKWADIGLAKAVSHMAGTVPPSVGGQMAATMEYAAPEVGKAIFEADSSVKITEKADVYSFGVLIREVYLSEMPTLRVRKEGFPLDRGAPIHSIIFGGGGKPHKGALARAVEARPTSIDLKRDLEELLEGRRTGTGGG